MEYKCTLLAVKDVAVSEEFYGSLFDQTVVLDLGKNVTFSGGFAIQEDFEWLADLPKGTVRYGNNDAELYFETDDIDSFESKLKAYGKAKLVHPPKTHGWRQRVIRLYDPDGHIIEVGESMSVVAKRVMSEGHTLDETAKIIMTPVEAVKSLLSQ